jgi:uncharacterized RDD family membrane protein YckC
MTSEGSQNTAQIILAGFWPRVGAFLLDGVITSIILFVLSKVLAFMHLSGGPGDDSTSFLSMGLGTIGGLIKFFIWFTYYDSSLQNSGSTPGMTALGIQVVDFENGELLSLKQVFLRQVIGLPLAFFIIGIGVLMIPFRKDRRGLHDLIAGSMVIKRPRSET